MFAPSPEAKLSTRGMYFSFLFFLAFGFLAFWLLGFLASWLFGFLASCFFGFSASCFLLVYAAFGGFGFSLFGRWRFGPCGFSLVYAAFGGFGFLHPLRSQFLWAFGFCTFHWFLNLASRIISITSSSLFESSLLRTSWGGRPRLDCVQSNCTPI